MFGTCVEEVRVLPEELVGLLQLLELWMDDESPPILFPGVPRQSEGELGHQAEEVHDHLVDLTGLLVQDAPKGMELYTHSSAILCSC